MLDIINSALNTYLLLAIPVIKVIFITLGMTKVMQSSIKTEEYFILLQLGLLHQKPLKDVPKMKTKLFCENSVIQQLLETIQNK